MSFQIKRTMIRLAKLRPNKRRQCARQLPWSRMSAEQRNIVIAVLNVSRWPVQRCPA